MTPAPDHAIVLVSSVLALELVFQTGPIYRYFAVPRGIVDGLIAAESKGAYFNTHVRHRFRYQRLS